MTLEYDQDVQAVYHGVNSQGLPEQSSIEKALTECGIKVFA